MITKQLIIEYSYFVENIKLMMKLLLFTLISHMAVAFHCSQQHRIVNSITSNSRLSLSSSDDDTILTVKASELDDSLGLTQEERTVVNVHRVCSPGVVYVTSVLTSVGGGIDSGGTSRRSSRRPQRWGKKNKDIQKQKQQDEEKDTNKQQKLPRGTALGSGSGFVMDSAGYIVTNYHVIQRAYEANDAVNRYELFWDNLSQNATNRAKKITGDSSSQDVVEKFINGTINAISGRDTLPESLPAQVFVRFGANGDSGDGVSNSAASYHPCEIVDVASDLDVAVLKIKNPPSSSLKQLRYGSSSDLLVGQSLLAIGNPFGLDRTITSGLVSALGRSVTGVAGNEIKNCIQTDAAINPGNSGGPLLNLNGEVVGVNTMIITTSGSSAGIGFAVPSNSVKESTDKIIEMDKERQLRSANRKGRGWLGIDIAQSSLEESLIKRLPEDRRSSDNIGAFVTGINSNSPLLQRKDESQPTSATGTTTVDTTYITNGNIHVGECIVNVGGTSIANGQQFVAEIKNRVEGEQLTLTVEDVRGEKRVVYVTLGKVPL